MLLLSLVLPSLHPRARVCMILRTTDIRVGVGSQLQAQKQPKH